MCGICGVIHADGRPASQNELSSMTNLMIHRGPDDEGFYLDGVFGLGFRRLSIVDLASGHQPMANENDSVWVVCNGEIYNHDDLRRELERRGHVFKSRSDVEVIVHLYEEYGIDCVRKLRGMFAFAVLDKRSERLFLARDHFGIKPLYYAYQSSGLRFSSELKSLLAHPDADFRLNEQTLWDYLTFQYVPQPDTLLEGIQKLPPAHYLEWSAEGISVRRYWQPMFEPDEGKSLSWFEDGIRHHLHESVQRHLQADVPVGTFLSSGIDSTIITKCARDVQPVEAFSIGSAGADPALDELGIAAQVAGQLGVRHHGIRFGDADILEHLTDIVTAMEEPLGDPSALALYFVSKLARQHVTVVLSGEGADEIFGGYPIYHEPKSLAMFNYLSEKQRNGLSQFAERLPYGMKGRSFVLRGTTPLHRRFVGNAMVFPEDAKQQLLRFRHWPQPTLPSFRLTDEVYRRGGNLDEITLMQMVDLTTWLPGDILLKADKMSMAHSLELRVPFLDVELFQFASTIPTKYRVHGHHGKYALRRAFQSQLPPGAAFRKKLGFPVPYRQWLKNSQVRDMAMDLFQSSSLRHWFEEGTLESMMQAHASGSRDLGRELWTVFILMLWHDLFQKSAKSAVAASSL